MNYKRKLKKELLKIEIPEISTVLPNTSTNTTIQKKRGFKKFITAPITLVILCLSVICCAAITIPIVSHYMNAKVISENNLRLTSVPDGYVGIYSAEDLNNMRHSPNDNYILMNDIVFEEKDFLEGGAFESGWSPIGSEYGGESFSGIFNGNGYVIKNLVIENISDLEKPMIGLFGETNGFFINVGLENCKIAPKLTTEKNFEERYICVGTLAAKATFIGACYTKSCEVSISLDNFILNKGNAPEAPKLCVGGLSGISNYIDSCISFTDISVNGGYGFDVSAGICSGESFSAVTSISGGDINIVGDNYASVATHKTAVTESVAAIPVLLDDQAMTKVRAKLKEHYGENNFYVNEFLAFFNRIEPSSNTPEAIVFDKYIEANNTFGYYETDEKYSPNHIYIFNNAATTNRVENMSSTLIEAFGGYDSFSAFCAENRIKCGMIDCYSFEKYEQIDPTVLKNFDLQKIFTLKNGELNLKIFVGE
ncbi:MAG: hypothetical protein E7641_04755 [Ruminococcaceae bacterium]|nr:hypothetical protein [Oscillospiraceae bacterium]